MKDSNGFEVIDVYSRQDAISDGEQMRIDDSIRKECGLTVPVFVTKKVWKKYLSVPVELASHQDFDGRVWDMLSMLRYYAKQKAGSRVIKFSVIFSMPDKGDWEKNEKPQSTTNRAQRMVELKAEIGPMDYDSPAPAITVMTPFED